MPVVGGRDGITRVVRDAHARARHRVADRPGRRARGQRAEVCALEWFRRMPARAAHPAHRNGWARRARRAAGVARRPGRMNVATHNKVAAVTAAFWVMKICATTLGETAGDLLSMTLDVGYAVSSLILIGIFIVTVVAQLTAKRFHPLLFWAVILSTSTAGTTMSDYMDRTLGLGYARGASILSCCLVLALVVWRLTEKSLSVSHINTRRAEVFYWIAILISNTLGTALGDYLADDSGLGFLGSALLIGSGLIAVL